jgi:GGDEF domain-containing protein
MDQSQESVPSLPGGAAIERLIQERIERQTPLAVLYIDLINLEPYCQKYGWAKGAQVIQTLANIIQETLATVGHPSDGCGHIVGDSFVIVSTPERAEHLAQDIINRFDAAILPYYSPEDQRNKYFDTLDRRGNPYRAYLIGVSIAIVSNAYRELEHVLQVEALASEVKKYIKLLPGSRYAFDRRHK